MIKLPPNHLIPKELTLTDDAILRAVEKFGTPLYIYDQAMLRKSWSDLSLGLPDKCVKHYSVKANPNIAIIQVFNELGGKFEVASLGELMATEFAGVSPKNVIFVGPGKTYNELHTAISANTGLIVAESRHEIQKINSIAKELKKNVKVALRYNPGQGKGMLSMGGDTQFGMELPTILDMMINEEMDNLDIVGLHGYLGARILDWKIILEHTKVILSAAESVLDTTGKHFSFIDVGGGFGIPLYESETSLDLRALRAGLEDLIKQFQAKYSREATIAIESGRFLVGPSGIFISRIIDMKETRTQKFIVLDGGVNVFGAHDHYAGSRITPLRLISKSEREYASFTLCGPLCTPMDRLAANVSLPQPVIGDLVCFYLAGAYGYSASPGLFLSHGFPAEVLANEGEFILIRQRSSLSQILAGQTLYTNHTQNSHLQG